MKANSTDKEPRSISCNFEISMTIGGCFALLPCGFSYNRNIASLREGDIIEDWDGNKAEVCDVGRLDARLKTTDMLSRMRYGLPIKRKISEWKTEAVYFGNSRTVVSDRECLLLTYKTLSE